MPQQLEQKPHYRKLIRMTKQKVMSRMKGQDKTPEKQLNEVDRQPSRKWIQNNDSEDDPGSWENNGEDARNVNQDL